ncbi:MAG TPA: arabinan endo-1,5-alpha-L-arabinosidase [Acidobacteriaceae bacterium]|nr:arabinan endo-1,5-alpha-L-arabinosidase [Acidobacteriaceae bacterium]
MLCRLRSAAPGLLSAALVAVCSCSAPAQAASSASRAGTLASTDSLSSYTLAGDTHPVHDPSIIRRGSTYYVFATDSHWRSSPNDHLQIRCSPDKIAWTACGSIFPSGLPSWIAAKVPGIAGLWAPDVSFFHGAYHVYYAGSTFGSQRSVIGLVTNTTLDPADPDYKWVDRGEVLESRPGDDFNAIDPDILIDKHGSVWLSFGSFWSGIKQRQIDPATGLLLASNPTRYNLATRPNVKNDPIEGVSLVRHGRYYYLFVSIDYCCKRDPAAANYKEAVGRSTSPHGPFQDESNTSMMNGGGTVLLQGDAAWNAAGGGTAYLDPSNGDSLIVFHALKMTENGAAYLWLKNLTWSHGWPAVGP